MNGARTALPEGGAKNAGEVCPGTSPGPKEAGTGNRESGAGCQVSTADSPCLTPGAKNNSSASTPYSPLPTPGSAVPLTGRQVGHALAERKLVSRVFERCHAAILAVCRYSSVPPEFLGALTANESGGNNRAARFEPAVYRHLLAVIAGQSPAYGPIKADRLLASLGRVLHPKADSFHAEILTPLFASRHAGSLSSLEDERLRELATSWGYTQIMGYHVLGRASEISNLKFQISNPDPKILLDPITHFKVALELLADFCARFEIDPTREFEEMFRCWNTGQPYGATYDPHYAENGLRRMALYAALARGEAPSTRAEVSSQVRSAVRCESDHRSDLRSDANRTIGLQKSESPEIGESGGQKS